MIGKQSAGECGICVHVKPHRQRHLRLVVVVRVCFLRYKTVVNDPHTVLRVRGSVALDTDVVAGAAITRSQLVVRNRLGKAVVIIVCLGSPDEKEPEKKDFHFKEL